LQKRQSLATGLAIGFLALMLAGLVARFWASDKAYQFTGPTHITAGTEQVYLFAAGDLYRLSLAGELLEVVSSEITGLNDEPIDLRVLPGGKLLIAEQRPARIRLCDVDSWNCQPLGATAASMIERQFKVLPGLSPGELLLTDAHGDTLWRLDDTGGEPKKLLPDGTLAGPNGMAFDASGRLWIADTDHRKIIELLPAENGGYLPVIHFSARSMKRKLGTDGKRLYIRLTDGRELSADPSQLAYTNRLILYRQYTLPLQGGKQQALYAPGEVETWIAPLLRQSRKLTEVEALKRQLKSWF
jgi:hypothetical protein